MRAVIKGWSFALVLALLLGNEQSHDQAHADEGRSEPKRPRRERLVGEHEVQAASARPGLELSLKRGFEVKLLVGVVGTQLLLRVAKARARSEEIAAGFVPIGPTVELSGAEGSVDVSFAAEQFHVRAGHQLTLASERAGPCPRDEACWQLVPASYEHGRCIARAVRVEAGGFAREQSGEGRRLQFGSLPIR